MYGPQGYDNPVRRQYAMARKNRLARMAQAEREPRRDWLSLGPVMAELPPEPTVARATITYRSFHHVGPHLMRETLTIDGTKRLASEIFGVSVEQLESPSRKKPIARARQVAMFVCRKELGYSFPRIARRFGNRDHTTIIAAVNRISSILERGSEPDVIAGLEEIYFRIRGSK